jgi:hypothetical protein
MLFFDTISLLVCTKKIFLLDQLPELKYCIYKQTVWENSIMIRFNQTLKTSPLLDTAHRDYRTYCNPHCSPHYRPHRNPHHAGPITPYRRLAQLSQMHQWIFVTSECPRPNSKRLLGHNILCHKIIQLKPSRTLSEYEVVQKAIQTGNASAVIVSDRLTATQQNHLTDMAQSFHCEIFFMQNLQRAYH